MVVADRRHHVAVGLVKVDAQDRTCDRYVEAVLADKRVLQPTPRHTRAARKFGQPRGVDLHDAQIVGAVAIVTDAAGVTTLDALYCRKRMGRQTIERRDNRHAGE